VSPRSARAGERRGDAGSTTVEIVFVLPLLFALVLVLAQVAVWAHATHVAQATAARALAAARADGGGTATGHAAATATLDQLGPATLHEVRVDVSRDAARSTVHVTGTASSVVPFLHPAVHAEAAGPVETRR
jgi:Flp pilus assembly protein TadG